MHALTVSLCLLALTAVVLAGRHDDYDRDGYDHHGYDSHGYDRHGYNKHGYDRSGCDVEGYNYKGYDKRGYDRHGYNAYGYNRYGYDRHGHRQDGHSNAPVMVEEVTVPRGSPNCILPGQPCVGDTLHCCTGQCLPNGRCSVAGAVIDNIEQGLNNLVPGLGDTLNQGLDSINNFFGGNLFGNNQPGPNVQPTPNIQPGPNVQPVPVVVPPNSQPVQPDIQSIPLDNQPVVPVQPAAPVPSDAAPLRACKSVSQSCIPVFDGCCAGLNCVNNVCVM